MAAREEYKLRQLRVYMALNRYQQKTCVEKLKVAYSLHGYYSKCFPGCIIVVIIIIIIYFE